MKNRERGQRRAADRRRNDRAEKRADNENKNSARRARDNAPQNSDERHRQKHRRPRRFFQLDHYFTDEPAGKITGEGADEIYEEQERNDPEIVGAIVIFKMVEDKPAENRERRKKSEHRAEIRQRLFGGERAFHQFGFDPLAVGAKRSFFALYLRICRQKRI